MQSIEAQSTCRMASEHCACSISLTCMSQTKSADFLGSSFPTAFMLDARFLPGISDG